MNASKWFLTILSAALLVQPAVAGDCASRNGDPACGAGGCCDDGCGPCLTCKLVNTTKKITVTCYGVKEDPVCLPCPSCKGCTNCEHLCARPGCSCSESCDCRPDCRVRWTEWCPCGAEMYCRKKLIKYEATKEIPWFKWVVVQDGCGEGAGQPIAPPAAAPKPAADPAPKPAAGKAAGITRPAPKGARVGDEFEVSEGDMKILQASYNRAPAPQVAPVAQASVQQPPVQPVAFAPAAVQSLPAAKTPAARTSGTQRLYDLIK